jgi:hypothetical protein
VAADPLSIQLRPPSTHGGHPSFASGTTEILGSERSRRGAKLNRASLDATDKTSSDLQQVGNLRTVQLLLGYTKLESTVRYLGIEVEDALSISEQVEL